jgi:hypothetical protein
LSKNSKTTFDEKISKYLNQKVAEKRVKRLTLLRFN